MGRQGWVQEGCRVHKDCGGCRNGCMKGCSVHEGYREVWGGAGSVQKGRRVQKDCAGCRNGCVEGMGVQGDVGCRRGAGCRGSVQGAKWVQEQVHGGDGGIGFEQGAWRGCWVQGRGGGVIYCAERVHGRGAGRMGWYGVNGGGAGCREGCRRVAAPWGAVSPDVPVPRAAPRSPMRWCWASTTWVPGRAPSSASPWPPPTSSSTPNGKAPVWPAGERGPWVGVGGAWGHCPQQPPHPPRDTCPCVAAMTSPC